jgi:AmmeMemoRadiSam system protein B
MRDATPTGRVRPPAVAGSFYPQDPRALRSMVVDCLAQARDSRDLRQTAAQPERRPASRPKAVIAPHAGYIYSGPIAGSAYGAVSDALEGIERVVLIGPSHFVPFAGLALPRAEAFQTPLGLVPVDGEARRELLGASHVVTGDAPHAREHSLEVQLPFLQVLLGEVPVLPIASGEATAPQVAAALERVWGGDETLIIVSSDLSHYLDYATARAVDTATAESILACSAELDAEQACGYAPVNGLLYAARRRHLKVRLLDLRNSGDTQPDRSRVVGYGAFALYEGQVRQ